MMITRDWPILLVESTPEGLEGRAVDMAAGRIMDGVCRHGHGEVLMDG